MQKRSMYNSIIKLSVHNNEHTNMILEIKDS